MNWNIAVGALATIGFISIVFGFLGGRRFSKEAYVGPIQDFVLANKALERKSIIQLLLSSSFSLNGMLYQIWLGYTIGVWALFVQFFWAISYPWLSKYVTGVRETSSLHTFLGLHYGKWTQIIGATCSIVGFTIMVGWEFNVGRATFEGLLPHVADAPDYLTYFMLATVFVSVIYTAMGGLGGDAVANRVQNFLKFFVFGGMIVLLGLNLIHDGDAIGWWDRLKINPLIALANLGLFGIITNLAFSLVWQFVDMSTWQGVIASKNKLSDAEAISALRRSGIAVFLAPGVLGTALGALLANPSGVTQDNIMIRLVADLPTHPLLIFVVFVALLATIMSMVDGELLASSYSFVCDILFRTTPVEELDKNELRGHFILLLMRIVLAIIALVGGVGVLILLNHGVGLFNITYVLVIAQLALFGPIFVGLQRVRLQTQLGVGNSGAPPSITRAAAAQSTEVKPGLEKRSAQMVDVKVGDRMVSAIVLALVVGYGAWIIGANTKTDWLVTGAGFFALLVSFARAKWLLRPVGGTPS